MTLQRNLDLEARLTRLERTNRKLKRIGGALGALAVAGVVAPFMMSSTPTCKTVWAERFVLRDAQNRERGLWDAYTTGGVPTLKMFNQEGEVALTITMDEEGPFLAFDDQEGELVRARLGSEDEGHPVLRRDGDGAQPVSKKDSNNGR